ncbi:MAG: hypothetical protein LCH63_15055 [Candidatus Melainabacteria bacterium]|nr:hypothetical protein [Candidatus Melainabacteria bacterium]
MIAKRFSLGKMLLAAASILFTASAGSLANAAPQSSENASEKTEIKTAGKTEIKTDLKTVEKTDLKTAGNTDLKTAGKTEIKTKSTGRPPVKKKKKKRKKKLTANQALKLVESRKEVQEFFAQFSLPRQGATAESKPVIDVEKDGNKWNVHVYESLPDHTATFNWYSVDRYTGKVTPMF